MTRPFKNFALLALQMGGAFGLARLLARRRLLVLTYHHVLPRPVGRDGAREPNVVYCDEFARHLAYLTRHCHVVSGDELRAYLAGHDLPPHSVLITFDDGYRNNYRYAFPLLTEYGASAVFFVTSGFIGDRRRRLWFDRLDAAIAASPAAVDAWLRAHDTFSAWSFDQFRRAVKRLSPAAREAAVRAVEHAVERAGTGRRPLPALPKSRCEPMSWEEVREMAGAGMLIGAHTVTHQILASASPDDVARELATSRATIEAHVGRECWCFSYPNGEAADFRDVDARLLNASGFECAFTQVPRLVDRRADRYALPRLAVPPASDFRVFLTRVSGLFPLLTPHRSDTRRWARSS